MFRPSRKLNSGPLSQYTDWTEVNWLRSSRPFLVVDFSLDRLEGNHLRALDNLLDVYGFNLTYELSGKQGDRENRATCSVVECSFSGDCYANKDFRPCCDCVILDRFKSDFPRSRSNTVRIQSQHSPISVNVDDVALMLA
uniref:(California timema) hypothetical protein n=1 Tax=Timema californicum TaxID=61474 RepID=A0A7R9IXM8_TIMCA|nr:unnamed protein product [Timema californicum]